MKMRVSQRISTLFTAISERFLDMLFTALSALNAVIYSVYSRIEAYVRTHKITSILRRIPKWAHGSMRIAAGTLVVGAIAFNIFNPAATSSQEADYDALRAGHPQKYGFPDVEEFVPRVLKSYQSQATVYNSVPWQTQGDPFVMADGTRVYDGAVAANCLAFGTQIRMPDLYGDKIFTVHDRLAADKSCYIIDIWQEYDPNSKSFGAPVTTIEIMQGSPSSAVAYVR